MLGTLAVSACLRKTHLSSLEITLAGIVAFFVLSACSEKAAFVEFFLARPSNSALKIHANHTQQAKEQWHSLRIHDEDFRETTTGTKKTAQIDKTKAEGG